MRESKIEQHLVKVVKALGGEVRKVQWIGRKGAPDRMVMLPGMTLWVELKATGIKAEAHQLREHKRMTDMGQQVVVVDSIEAIDQIIFNQGTP